MVGYTSIPIIRHMHVIMHIIVSVDGTCFNIPAGSVDVELRIESCLGDNDGLVGWGNNRQLLIMEIIPRAATAGIIIYILVQALLLSFDPLH